MIDRRVVALAALLAAASGTPAAGEILDRVLAVVSGEVVTLSDARAAIALGLVGRRSSPDPIADAVAALVDRRLVLHEVERYQPPEPDAASIEQRARELAAALPADVPVDVALAALALDAARLRQLAREELRIAAYLQRRFGLVQPSDEDVAAYYRTHQAELARAGEVPPLAEVRDELRRRLAAARRDALVAEWVADLRRRADILVLYPGALAPTGR
jgi:hypothetical protein